MGGRTIEEPIAIEDSYRELLRVAVSEAGGQYAAAQLSGVNQSTISRTLAEGGRATYTTLMKLHRAIPGLPEPMVSVRNADHAEWCRIGAQLAEKRPAIFEFMLRAAREAMLPAEISDASTARVKSVIASAAAGAAPTSKQPHKSARKR